jgi:multidrug efflux pump subunit AcrB
MSRQPEEKSGPIAFMAGNPVAANLVMVFLIIGGLFATNLITQEIFPDITPNVVNVSVSYPGASPEEVEQGIILAVEEAVMGLDNVQEITSRANENVGIVSVEMHEGGDLELLLQDVKSSVDRITTFPDDAEDPVISIASRRRQVIDLMVYGDVPMASLREAVEQVRDRLLQDEKITQVDLSGIRDLEIAIEIPVENLRRYNLTINEVTRRLNAASIEMPGGGLDTPGGEILVRVNERRQVGREFALTPIITGPDGSEVLLEDIATIRDSFTEGGFTSRFNGQPAMRINVYRIGKETPIQVSDAVKKMMPEIRAMLPPGISIDIRNNRADNYRERLHMLLRNGAMGLVLVLIILGVFLELRLAFWVMMGIPISFMGTLLMMPFFDASINMISLFAFIIALGIVVDDAIVVGENVYYHHQRGNRLLRAAVIGTREMAMPVTFSILTNIVAFLPMLFVPGIAGRIFGNIPLVVILAFSLSLLESLFILPAHLGHYKARKRYGIFLKIYNGQQLIGKRFAEWIHTSFQPWLNRIMKHRYAAVSVALSILIVAVAYAASGRMGFSMFSRVESDFARAEVILPFGTPVEKTEKIMEQLYLGARKVADDCGCPELVTGIYGSDGMEGDHSTVVWVYLAEADIRDDIMSTNEFVQLWRENVGPIPTAEQVRFESDFGGPGSGRAISIELIHRDVTILQAASRELAEELQSFPMVSDIIEGYARGKRQVDFTLKPEAKSLGLTAVDIARQLRHAFYGLEVSRQQRGRNEVRTVVRLPLDERDSAYFLEEFLVRTPGGNDVPLRDIAEFDYGRAYTTIERRNARRVLQVMADVQPRDQANQVLNVLTTEKMPEMEEKYPGLTWNFAGQQADIQDSMISLYQGFALALLAIYALLAIPFRSYVQPLIVMVGIPFGIIGAIGGHIMMGYGLSVISLMGIIALSGVVVNDSLVLIDYANRLRKKYPEINAHDAAVKAAVQRFRPIVLTTLTTFFGLTPMMFERSRQARFLIPMAISLGWGILFATMITLILVPCLYMVVEDTARALKDGKRAFRKLLGIPLEPEWIDVEREPEKFWETQAGIPLPGKKPDTDRDETRPDT